MSISEAIRLWALSQQSKVLKPVSSPDSNCTATIWLRVVKVKNGVAYVKRPYGARGAQETHRIPSNLLPTSLKNKGNVPVTLPAHVASALL